MLREGQAPVGPVRDVADVQPGGLESAEGPVGAPDVHNDL